MAVRALVIDANILIRATLGIRARNIIKTYSTSVALCVPEPAWRDAEKHLTLLAAKRQGDPEKLLRVLRSLADLVYVTAEDTYLDSAPEAGQTRSGRLAYPGLRSGSGLPHLDGGCRFLRLWCGDLDL